MSFAPQFDHRWTQVIQPAVARLELDGHRLDAHRVDARKVSDSILTEIMTGISESVLVLGDVTSLGSIDERPIRNGNVMYEIGIAHACRIPEEVVLFRSDNDPLLFDTSNVRVNTYDPDNDPHGAGKAVTEALASAIREVDLRRNLTAQRYAAALDATGFEILSNAHKGYAHPRISTMGDALGNSHLLASLRRLLDIGALEAVYATVTRERPSIAFDEAIRYRRTKRGDMILGIAATRLGITPDFLASFDTEEKDDTRAV